jgi:hypothetical protein
MNGILLRNVSACENDHNLVFTHVPSQCPFTCATKYFREWEFHHINNIGKALALYAPSSITLKVGWYTWVSGIKIAFSTLHVIMASITLFFMKPFFSFPMCACSGVQWLLLITTPTNQSYALQGLLCQEQINVSMHHHMIQCSLWCLGWNGALFEHPPSIILQT